MGFKLVLDIEGLCALVPITDDTGYRGLDVLLVNAQFNRGLKLPRHVATLQALGGSVAEAVLPSGSGPARKAEHGSDTRSWELNDCVMTIKARSAHNDSDGLTIMNIERVADLARIVPDVRSRQGLTTGGDGRVTAALRLWGGRLQVEEPTAVNGRTPPALVFSPPPPSGNYGQQFADRVRYTFETSHDHVELRMHPFQGGPPSILYFAPPPEQNEVALTISNTPPRPHMSGTSTGGGMHPLGHFAAYYELLERRPTPEPLPVVPVDTIWDPPACIGAKVPHPPPLPDPPPWAQILGRDANL